MIKGNHFVNYIFITMTIMITLCISLFDNFSGNNNVIISNYIIVFLSILFMYIGDEHNFSLNKMFMLFCFFFFGIAPLIQYQHGVALWINTQISDESFLELNYIIIIIMMAYQLAYTNFSKLAKKEKQAGPSLQNQDEITYETNGFSSRKLVLISTISLIVIIYVYNFSLEDLLLRSGDFISINSSVYSIFTCFIRPIPVIVLLIYRTYCSKNIRFESYFLFIAILSNFPTATARFYTACIYIAIALSYIPLLRKNYMLLNKLVMLSFLVIFPLLDQARRITSLSEFEYGINLNMFLTEHFDSYQMFVRVLESNLITYGSQLMTVIFFFVPRVIWEGKSIGSGALIAQLYNFPFENVSMNYFAEGYINFGYLGIALFTVALAFYNAKLDTLYWIGDKKSRVIVFYFFAMGLQFFVMRGDLLSGMAATVGILFSNIAVVAIARSKKNLSGVKEQFMLSDKL